MSELSIPEEKFRSRQSVPGDYLQTLLNSLTLDNIRDAIYTLAPNEKITIKNHAGSLEAVLKTHKSKDVIIDTLLAIERESPLKHCLFLKCATSVNADPLRQELSTSRSAKGFEFRLRSVFDSEQFLILTFEHYVEVKEWVEESDDTKRLLTFSTRHPIIFRLSKKTKLTTLNYPGFSQGAGTKKDKQIAYSSLLESLIKVLEELGFVFRILSVKESLKVFLNGDGSRVRRIKVDVDSHRGGRLDLTAESQQKTVEDVIADLLIPHMTATRTELMSAAKNALNDADANSLVLYWSIEQVVTRLKFWDIGCEALFVWHGAQASYRVMDAVVELIAGAYEKFESAGTDIKGNSLRWLVSLSHGTIVTPARIAQELNLEPAKAKEELIQATKFGILIPVYRLATTQTVDGYDNSYTAKLSQLRSLFTTQSGDQIDGYDTSLIEVAFKRIGELGVAQ